MITLDKALQAINKAITKAVELNEKVTVTVVDKYGVMVASQKMDEALVVSPKFAMAKAYTAAVIKLATEDIAKYSSPGQPFYGTTSAFEGEMMVIAGGFPITEKGEVVGAIGVGGSHDPTKDAACAKEGLTVFQ
ncbi:MAG TPA: heme-binding protein [Patescibacteria group bacterium]